MVSASRLPLCCRYSKRKFWWCQHLDAVKLSSNMMQAWTQIVRWEDGETRFWKALLSGLLTADACFSTIHSRPFLTQDDHQGKWSERGLWVTLWQHLLDIKSVEANAQLDLVVCLFKFHEVQIMAFIYWKRTRSSICSLHIHNGDLHWPNTSLADLQLT